MTRADYRPRARIDHAALRHNLERVRAAAPERRVWAVVKANAYGHGLDEVAATLAPFADGLAVARTDEALSLRRSGQGGPILVLEGAHDRAELEQAGRHGLEIVVHQPFQAQLLLEARLERPLRVWVKVDTGMHRLGLEPDSAAALGRELATCPNCEGSPRWLTHLANGDDLNDPYSQRQLARMRRFAGPDGVLSMANSAGVLGWPESHGDWVRPGIMLYGVSPFQGELGPERDLRPVMSLEARLISVKQVPKGAPVGYGGSYVCPEAMPVGAAAIGYGDGYPRHAPGGTPVLVNGRRVPLIGRVSMDLLTLDLRSQPDAQPGDLVRLWGPDLPVAEVAAAAGTIGYELLCRLTRRLRFEHVDFTTGTTP